MKIYLTTFYSSDLKRSAERFQLQAQKMQIYDKIFLFSEKDLDKDFNQYVSSLLKLGKKKGYGYWVWQTFFHKKVLSQMNDGDIYHCCDVGCHFNLKGKSRWKEDRKILEKEQKGLLEFQYKDWKRVKRKKKIIISN